VSLSLHLIAIFPGEPGLAGFIGTKDNGSGGENWCYETCKATVKSNRHHQQTNLLQAGCLSRRAIISVAALKGKATNGNFSYIGFKFGLLSCKLYVSVYQCPKKLSLLISTRSARNALRLTRPSLYFISLIVLS